VPRKIFGHEKYKERGKCKKLHNEEFNNLYSLPNTIQVTKSGRIKWGACSKCVGEER